MNDHKMECNACLLHDMLTKCMFMANNCVIVMHLLLYTRKGEGKGRK